MPDVNPARVREVLEGAAAATTGPERAAYLERACAGDVPLRAEVESLLAALDREPAFMGAPTADRGALMPGSSSPTTAGDRAGADHSEAHSSHVERPGATVGRYKLLERIGEGGFGVVYMAEQHHPVRRRVALKVVKLGMDSRQVLARFDAERQALAIMDHPNIAKVFDGGMTDAGRPYFVMELVKGEPITEFCDRNRLPPRQRLELFVQVCHAVQHAHQKGIIHRDIKPTNVLVAVHDTTPVVKVIDFGIAKALGQELTERTLFTGFAQLIGTPLYMSPEQAGHSALDVDTRSDIYSLGVLLYELLTGTTPFDKERFRKAAQDEIRRIICEEEPPRPSTRLSMAAALPTLSANRSTEPKRLTGLLRNELDWVVMKALEKDRGRRYETANGLAADVRRYLAGEAVLAHPPSAAYRLRKFARRNKARVVAASLVLSALVAGVVGTSVGLARAKLAAAVAKVATGKAEQSAAAEREAKNLAEARLAYGKVDEGNALGAVGRWDAAKARYEEAYGIFTRLNVSPLAADLGLWDAYRFSPPELARFHVRTPSTLTGSGGVSSSSLAGYWAARPNDLTASRPISRPTHDEETFDNHVGRITGVAFSPDSRLAISSGVDGRIKVWEVFTGRGVRSLKVSSSAVNSIGFSPDGLQILAGCADGSAALWNAAGEARPLSTPPHRINAVAFSPDGSLVATGGADGAIRVWDARTGDQMREILVEREVLSIAFLPDGKRIFAGENGWPPWAKVWDIHSAQAVLAITGHVNAGLTVAVSRDGLVGLTRESWSIKASDLTTGQTLGEYHDPRNKGRGALAMIGGQRLALAGYPDGTVKVWDLMSRSVRQVCTGQTAPITCVAASEDGRLALAGAEDGTLALHRLAPYRETHAMRVESDDGGAQNLVTRVDFSEDSRLLMARAQGGTSAVFDVATGRTLWSARDGLHALSGDDTLLHAADLPDEVVQVPARLTSDGRRVIFCRPDGAICEWDVQAKQVVSELAGHSGKVNDLVLLGGDASALTAGADGLIGLWDLRRHKLVHTFAGHSGGALALAVSIDGTRALSGGADKTIRLWDLLKHEQVLTLTGHGGPVDGVAFGRGGLAMSGSQDQTVKFWDLIGRRELRSLSPVPRSWKGGKLGGHGVAISRDGRWAAAIGQGSNVSLWDLDTAAATRNLLPRTIAARERLHGFPHDTDALETLGEWYDLNAMDDVGAEMFLAAGSGGHRSRSLAHARGAWVAKQPEEARRWFELSRDGGGAPAGYVQLCLDALDRDFFGHSYFAGAAWIWSGDADVQTAAAPASVRYFRRSFELSRENPAKRATLYLTADDGCIVYMNGTKVLARPPEKGSWQTPSQVDLTTHVRPGVNVLAVNATNSPDPGAGVGPAGVLARMVIDRDRGEPVEVVTDDAWKVSEAEAHRWRAAEFDDTEWSAAVRLGAAGDSSRAAMMHVPKKDYVEELAAEGRVKWPVEQYVEPNGRVRDLLPLANPMHLFDQSKSWTGIEGELVSSASSRDILILPYDPPEEYDFIIEFTRSGNDAVCQYLVKPPTVRTADGRHGFSWAMGGWGNRVCGFEAINGAWALDNPTKLESASSLATGRRHTSVVQVRKDRVRAFLDGRLLSEWKTDYADLSYRWLSYTQHRPRFPERLGLHTWDSATTFHAVRVIEVTGRGTVVLGEDGRTTRPVRAQVGPPEPAGRYLQPKGQVFDLLAGVDLARDAIMGRWRRDGKTLVSDDSLPALVTLPLPTGVRPPAEYDFLIEYTVSNPASGRFAVSQQMIGQGHQFGWTMGAAEHGLNYCGFERVHGMHSFDFQNPAAVVYPIEGGQKYTSVAQVRRSVVRAFLNGRLLVEHPTDFSELTPMPGWELPENRVLSMGSFLRSTRFSKAQLVIVPSNAPAAAPPQH